MYSSFVFILYSIKAKIAKLCGSAKRMPHVIKQVFLFPLGDALEFQYCFFGWLLHGVMFPWPDGLVEKR